MVVISIFLVICFGGLCAFTNDRNRGVYLSLTIILILLAGFRGEGVDHDYGNYVQMYHSDLAIVVEPTFTFICWLCDVFGVGAVGMFLTYAVLGVSIKMYAIRHLAPFFWLSVIIYISNAYILLDLNQIRAGVSAGLLLLMVKPIHERNMKQFLMLGGVATLFHYSSLLMFPLYFIITSNSSSRKIFLWKILPVLGYICYYTITYIDIIRFIPFEPIRMKLEMYRALQESGNADFAQINLLNLHTLFRLALFCFFAINYQFFKQKNKYFYVVFKIYAIALFLFPTLGSITPILGYRSSELLGVVEILLYPMIVYILKPKTLSTAIVFSIGLLLFFVDVFYKQYIYLI